MWEIQWKKILGLEIVYGPAIELSCFLKVQPLNYVFHPSSMPHPTEIGLP